MIKTFENFLNESNNYGFAEIEPEKIHDVFDRLKFGDNILIACHWVVYPYIQQLLNRISDYEPTIINCPNLSDDPKDFEVFSNNKDIFFLKNLQRCEGPVFKKLMNKILENQDSIFVCVVNYSDKDYPFDDFMSEYLTPVLDRFNKVFKVVVD